MKKNIKLKVAFCNISNKKIAILSTDEKSFFDYTNAIRLTLGDTEHSIDIDELMVQIVTIKAVKDNILETIMNTENVIVVDNISSAYQLHIWLSIKSNSYEAKENWDSFLAENNLLQNWIDGDLSVVNAHSYTERSKEFGYRGKLKKIESKINTYEDIWKLSEFFKTEPKATYGVHARYSYTTDSKIIEVKSKTHSFKLNQKWLEEKEENNSLFGK